MDWMIETRNDNRREKWLQLFGCESLPVRDSQPTAVIRTPLNGLVPAFQLDASRLHNMAVARFAGRLARRLRVKYEDALGLVDGWSIDATDCEVVAVSSDERPLLPHFAFGDVRRNPVRIFPASFPF